MKLSAVVVGIFVSVVFLASCGDQSERFFTEARQKLQTIKGPSGSSSIPPVVSLPSGQWFAVILEHSCCVGAGYDAVMIMDSEKNIFTSRSNYCGYEGFDAALAYANIQNLSQLHSYLESHNYKKQ